MKWKEIPSPIWNSQARLSDSHCCVIFSHEPLGPGGELRWHLSISHPKRYPHWDEIRDARYAFIPDGVTMAMLLPPQSEYVNVHRNCFHLYEFVGNEIITKL